MHSVCLIMTMRCNEVAIAVIIVQLQYHCDAEWVAGPSLVSQARWVPPLLFQIGIRNFYSFFFVDTTIV